MQLCTGASIWEERAWDAPIADTCCRQIDMRFRSQANWPLQSLPMCPAVLAAAFLGYVVLLPLFVSGGKDEDTTSSLTVRKKRRFILCPDT